MTAATVHPLAAARREYLRPLWLGILFAVAGELFIFLVFGLLLNGPANCAEHPVIFLANGIAASAAGGLALGWLLFTDPGRRWLDRHRL